MLIDFHVHTAASRCYADPEVPPEAIVEAAVAQGLEAIAVNDHHTAVALDRIRSAASAAGITVFPGVEITTQQGHIVGLFEPDVGCEAIWTLLDDLGVPHDQRGNGHYRIRPHLLEVVDAINSSGGLPIPAHVDRWPNGFMEAPMSLAERRRIHEYAGIDVVEITLPDTKSIWEAGGIRGLPRALTCIQGSDAHSTDEVGRRPTLVDTTAGTIAGLRDAFGSGRADRTRLMDWR